MPESLQEQRPLLCDEYSDEESRIQDSGPKFHRRFRHSVRSGRARTHAAGAASIISSWPDNLSSLLAYWWIALGMFAFMVFLIYNSILAIAVLPETHSTLRLDSSNDVTDNKPIVNPSKPNIYMHVFVANYEEYNSNDYVPYVQIITKKYTNFKYNFIVVLNDTVNDKSDEQKNEMALNFLWSDNKIIMSNKKLHEDFTVTYVSLKEYMDNSPLKKYWRLVPYQFIGFLARCVAIWDKGGIAFEPFILTPNSPNSVYLEKLNGVLGNYQSNSKIMVTPKRNITKKSKKKVNNIRDIIIDLENGENMNENIFSDNLEEAENIQTATITSSKNKRNVNSISFDRHSPQFKEKTIDEILDKNNFNNENKQKSSNFIKPIKEINTTQATGDIAAAQNILSNFLKHLFHLNSKNLTSLTRKMNNFTKDFTLSENVNLDHFLNNDTTSEIGPVVKELNIKAKTKYTNKTPGGNENTKLTLDLKGNIIATEIGCHAFIGTVFSNVFHHTNEESITDFIINELSLFCKGSLSTCNNVEVILL